ncbi:MAG: hypothetical protein L0Z53_03175 [Acidobacteriales bacterium]|nr:hypothetical protein [Terriglobales bacterium]
MITVEQEVVITPDHRVTVQVPASIPPGRRRVVVVFDSDEPVSDETHVGLEDFPQFPNLHLMQEYLGRDVIYDPRGR